jgi:UDP-N-acetylglucosamine 2-epimerase (non-hydrolysing)
MGVKVAHVEAGIRSRDRTMPEEINRLVTDSISDLLLTPSEDANENLAKEGADPARIHLVGNIMIDSLISNLPKAENSAVLNNNGLEPGSYVYVTLHRPSNVDRKETLVPILEAFRKISVQFPVLFPIHPRTKASIERHGLDTNGGDVRFIEPVGYHDSLWLTKNARVVVTDSGGLQEESTYFRTPCLTLRPNTERPVTVTIGSNKLTTPDELLSDLETVLSKPERFGSIPEFWDGNTAERVLEVLTTSGV